MVEKLENLTPAPSGDSAAVRDMATANQAGAPSGDRTVTKAATDTLVQNKTLPGVDLTGFDGPLAAPMAAPQTGRGSELGNAAQSKDMDKQDVLREADQKAIHDAKAKGDTTVKFDDAFYKTADPRAGSGSLKDFDPVLYKSAGTTRSIQSPTSGDGAAGTAGTTGSERTQTSGAVTSDSATAGTRTDASGVLTGARAGAETATTTAAAAANLHRSDRLTANADGSADTTVKPGDNLWRIAKEALRQNKPEDYKPSDRDVQEAVRKIAEGNHIRNPNLIHPGDRIHIPKELITKPPEVAPHSDTRRPPEVPVEVRNASPEYAAEVKRQFDTLPENVRRLLAESGNKIVVGGKLSDADPDLRGVRPRGWPPGSTWDDDDGLYNPTKKEITVAQTHFDHDRNAFVNNDRTEGSIKHEAGHAVDAALGNMSHSDDFKQAFDADVARMSAAEKQRFAYLLQDGHAGHEETFAEVFGGMNGSSANRDQTAAIMRDFPTVRALMQRRLSQLP